MTVISIGSKIRYVRDTYWIYPRTERNVNTEKAELTACRCEDTIDISQISQISQISHMKERRGMQEQDQKPSIKQLRIQAGLSVFKLAMKAGISVSTVNRLEKGDRKVSLLSANRVLNILSQELRQEITTNSVKKLFIGEEDQDQEEQS